jgi:hypothetical protein
MFRREGRSISIRKRMKTNLRIEVKKGQSKDEREVLRITGGTGNLKSRIIRSTKLEASMTMRPRGQS